MEINHQAEDWRAIPGYEYEASDLGRIRNRGGHVLRPTTTKCGYETVRLYGGVARGRRRTVHTFVAAAFLCPRRLGHTVNHRDGNKKNNHPSNLEYLSSGDNQRHAYRTGLKHARRGEENTLAKLSNAQAGAIRTLSRAGESQARMAVMFGVGQATISRIVNRKHYATC